MNIMLIKSQVVRQRILYPSFSIIKSLKCGPNMKQVNPFRHKTYAELNRILDSTMAKEQYINMHNLILNAISSRVQQESTNKKNVESASRENKLALLNKCLFRLIQKQQELTPNDIITIVQSILTFQASKELNLSKDVFIQVKMQLGSIIEEMAKNDQQGKYQQQFHKILYLSLSMGSQIRKVRELVGYFYHHSLKTNQQIIQFLTFLFENSQISDYSSSVQKILARYINNNIGNLQNARQWLHPIIIDVFINAILYQKKQNTKLIRKYISAIKHSFSKGQMDLQTKLLFLQRVVNFGVIDDFSFLTTNQLQEDAKFTYSLFKQTLNELKLQKPLSQNQNCMFVGTNFRRYFKRINFALDKSSNEIEEELRDFIEQIFLKRIITDGGSINLYSMINFIKKDIEMSVELEKKAVYLIVQNLNQQTNLRNLISKIRLYEYVAYRITEKKLGLDPQLMKKCLARLENNIHRFNKFIIIRVYNVMRILNFKSKAFEDFYTHFCKQNQIQVIQNFSRTILKKHSTSIILKLCEEMMQKINKIEESQETIETMKAIWNSLRSFQLFEEDAKNQIFQFWLVKNEQFFTEITSLYRNVMALTKFMTSQMKTSLQFSSIRLELLIETLRFYYLNNIAKSEGWKFRQFIQISMRFVVHPLIVNFVLKEYRHSLFVKCIWSYSYLLTSYKKRKQFPRSHLVIHQMKSIMRLDEQRSIRETRCLKKNLLWYLIEHLDLEQLGKMNLQSPILQFWAWYHKNNISQSKVNKQLKHNLLIRDKIYKIASHIYGPYYKLQFALSVFPKISYDFLRELKPESIYQKDLVSFNFNKNTPISHSQIIDYLSFPTTLHFFLSKNQNSPNQFFTRLSEVDISFDPIKIIQAQNIFLQLKNFLNKQTELKFYAWINQRLERLFNYGDIVFPLICLKVFRIPQFGEEKIRQYVRKQFENGNFYINSLVYCNGIRGISNEVRDIFEYCLKNRVIDFLIDQPRIYLGEINNLFGMVLLQNDEVLLQDFLVLYQPLLQKIESSISLSMEEKQLFVLLKVANNRQKQKGISANITGEAIDKVNKKCNNVTEEILGWLQSQETNWKLKQNILYLDTERKGPDSLIFEYVTTLEGFSKCTLMERDTLSTKTQ